MSVRDAEAVETREQARSQPAKTGETSRSEFASLLGELTEPFRTGMGERGRGVQRAIQLRRRYGAEGFRNLLQRAWVQRKAKRQAAGWKNTMAFKLQASKPEAKAAPGPRPGGGRPPVLRIGGGIPSGARIQNATLDDAAVEGLVYDAAYASAGGYANDANFASRLRPNVRLLQATNLALPGFSFSFEETKGLNMDWEVSLSWSVGAGTLMQGGGRAGVSAQTGGSASVAAQQSQSTTDSMKVTGGAKAGEAKAGGEGSVGVEAGTSTTTGQQTTTTGNVQGTATLSLDQQMERYSADVYGFVTVNGSANFSGTDYINPFKWGSAAATEILTNGPQNKEGKIGSVEYLKLGGMLPAQRKTWLEHQLGERILTDDEANRLEGLHRLDTRDFSRDGARPLPPQMATAASEHHGASLEGVRLVQGGQADAYCDQMNAAAFTTPSAEGHSDIFVHSGVSLDTPEGQHTVQHEIAHAVQNQKGETQALSGLGGDAGERDRLERAADSHATEVMAQAPVQKKETGESEP